MAQILASNEKKLMMWTLSMILTSNILFFIPAILHTLLI